MEKKHCQNKENSHRKYFSRKKKTQFFRSRRNRAVYFSKYIFITFLFTEMEKKKMKQNEKVFMRKISNFMNLLLLPHTECEEQEKY